MPIFKILKNKTTLKNTLCSHLGLCLFGEWHYAFYLIFQICSFLIWKMRIALIVLGWPKGLFGCFRNIVWKTRKNFLANPVLKHYRVGVPIGIFPSPRSNHCHLVCVFLFPGLYLYTFTKYWPHSITSKLLWTVNAYQLQSFQMWKK